MSVPKDSSSMRYFWASLRPLGRPLFWVPLGLASLSLIGYWQYQQNPDWLSGVREQPGISIEENDLKTETIPPNSVNSTTIAPSTSRPSAINRPAPIQPADNLERADQADSDPTNTLLAPITPTSNPRSQKSSSSLFLPLLPTLKQNSAPSPTKSLQPIQIPPTTDDGNNYPLQREIENLSRGPSNNSPDNPATNSNPQVYRPNQVPTVSDSVPSNYQPYRNNPNVGQGIPPQIPTNNTQPNTTGYPNQGTQPSYGTNPYQVPTQTQTQGYTIQPPINARSSGY
jgi:hypothetical protein